MKGMIRSKALAILTTVAMVFTVAPMMGTAAYAEDPAPAVKALALGTDVLSRNVNQAEGIQKVRFGSTGEDWYVIGYNGTGNDRVSRQGTISLFHVGVHEYTKFNVDSASKYARAYGWVDSDEKKPQIPSNLRNFIETRYITGYEDNGQQVPARFSDLERSAIVPKTLEGSNVYNNHAVYIFGKSVENALIWPLSGYETVGTPQAIFKIDNTIWWLRSPSYSADRVRSYDFYDRDDWVGAELGVRPAFDLSMTSVILTSSAKDGKVSGPTGSGSLRPVGAATSDEWKLTLHDAARDGFKVDSVTGEGNILTVQYSGAKKAANEYISAIIKSKSGEITYYGRLGLASDEEGATVDLNIAGKLGGCGDTICIFNEQLNGDNKTDYSSPLREITLPKDPHDWNPATCTEPLICKNCGEEKGEPLGHDYAFKDFTWEGDEIKGYTKATANYECTRDSSHKDTIKIHHLIEGTKQPTCTEDGGTTYTAIVGPNESPPSLDGKLHVEEKLAKAISALGHDWGEWTELAGTDQHQRICQRDPSHVEKANHIWDAGTVTKAPTEQYEGVKACTCTICKATKTETIPRILPNPPATSVTKLIRAKKAFTVKWKTNSDVTGYQIMYSRNKAFKKGKKTVTVNGAGKASKKIRNLKAKKKYYVKIRTYKTVNGVNYYSPWSKAKAVRTK